MRPSSATCAHTPCEREGDWGKGRARPNLQTGRVESCTLHSHFFDTLPLRLSHSESTPPGATVAFPSHLLAACWISASYASYLRSRSDIHHPSHSLRATLCRPHSCSWICTSYVTTLWFTMRMDLITVGLLAATLIIQMATLG